MGSGEIESAHGSIIQIVLKISGANGDWKKYWGSGIEVTLTCTLSS